MPRLKKTEHLADITIISLIGLAVNLILLAYIGLHQPEYLKDYQTNINPDAKHYVLLGKNLWTKGVFSRQAEPPYQPDIIRTPVYPIMTGFIVTAFKAIWPLYLI